VTAYFTRLPHPDDQPARFRATEHTSGAWAETEQHIAPMVGLLVHEVERVVGDDGKVLGRLSMDIFGVIEVDDFEVAVEVVRPGRTIALVEATVTRNGRTVVVARLWRLQPRDTSPVAGGAPAALPAPDSMPAWDMPGVWPGGFIRSVEVRRSPDARPGRGQAWLRTDLDLVEGEKASEIARWAGLLDAANGIVVRESPDTWLFPNVDLTLHLHRQPAGEWVGLDTTVVFGDDGLGVTESVLHDADGPVGRMAQVLTLRPRG